MLERFNLLPYHSLGQPIGRYGVSQHAAGLPHGIEDSHTVASFAQEVASSEAGGTGAHDRYVLVRQHIRRLEERRYVLQNPVAEIALDCPCRDGFVKLTTVTVRFTKMRTNPTGDGGHRIALHHESRCPLPVSFTNQPQISGNVNVSGTTAVQGGAEAFLAPKIE